MGILSLTEGACDIILRNGGSGRLSADAVKLTDEENRDYILDDLQTNKRVIGYIDSDSLEVLSGSNFTADGRYRVYQFSIALHSGFDRSSIDYLQRRTSDRFLETAWKPYFDRFGDYMGSGRTMNGIFSDHEGDYGYKMAWSDDLRDHFGEKYGEDIKRILPLLIDRDEQGKDVIWRYRWFDAASDIYAGHFRKMSEKAAEHDMYYTMHTWEESLQIQAACVGDVYKVNRGVSLPGTDALHRISYNPQNFKDLFSLTEYEGLRFMDEIMALIELEGYNSDELKRQSNYLALYGVSHVIDHSVKMTRRLAQEQILPDFYNIDPGWQAMGQYSDFLRRTSYINSLGRTNADVLLLNPIDSMYALAENDVFDMSFDIGCMAKVNASFGGEAGEINRQYGEIIRRLTRGRVEFLTADKVYFSRMKVTDDTLVMKTEHGSYVFHTVIVPRSVIIDRNTAQKLSDFAHAGGKVIWIGNLPSSTLQAGRNDGHLIKILDEMKAMSGFIHISDPEDLDVHPSIEVSQSGGKLLSHWRIIDGRHVIFICNNENETVRADIRLPGISGRTYILDPVDGREKMLPGRCDDDCLTVSHTFAGLEAIYLVVDPSSPAASDAAERIPSRIIDLSRFSVCVDEGNREKTLTHSFSPAETGKIRLIVRKGPWEDPEHPDVREIKVFAGEKIIAEETVNETFEVKYDEVKAVEVSFDPQSVDSVLVSSGRPLTSYRIEYWDREWWKTAAELDSFSQNEVINPINYPVGTYEVRLDDWSGWEFLPEKFAGILTYRCEFELDENEASGNAEIEIGRFVGSAEVFVNGKRLGAGIYSPMSFPAGGKLLPGRNTLEIRVGNSIACNVIGTSGGIRDVRIKLFQ